MDPQLLPSTLTCALLAVLALLPTAAQQGSQVMAEVGSLVRLSCNLMGPSLRWDWLPRYPCCAGVSSELQTIYTETAAGAQHVSLERFQTRLHRWMALGTRTAVLELEQACMTDSGTFICANSSQEGLPVWVTITPGCQTGAFIEAMPQPPKEGEAVSLSCIPCGEEGPTTPPKGETTWLFNGKLLPNSSSIRILRTKVIVKNFSSRFEGLWSCRLPGDPQWTATYCLERIPGVHRTQGSPSPSPTHPEADTTAPTSDPRLPVIVGCVGAALVLILMGAGAFIYCRLRQPRDVSVTRPVPNPEVKLTRAEAQPGPTEPAGGEQTAPAPDLQPEDEGPGGIQYAALNFQEPGGTVGRGETGPATIYSQVATRTG